MTERKTQPRKSTPNAHKPEDDPKKVEAQDTSKGETIAKDTVEKKDDGQSPEEIIAKKSPAPPEPKKAPEPKEEGKVSDPVAPNIDVDPRKAETPNVALETDDELKQAAAELQSNMSLASGLVGVVDTSDTAGITVSESMAQMAAARQTDFSKKLEEKAFREAGVDLKQREEQYKALEEAQKEQRKARGQIV